MRRRFKSRLQRGRLLVQHRAAYVSGAIGLVIGIATVGGTTVPGLAIAVVGLLLGSAGAFLDWRAYRKSVSCVHLRPATNVDFRNVDLPELLKAEGYRLRALGGSEHERAATSDSVNELLRQGWDPPLKVVNRNWHPPVAEGDAYAILRECSRGGIVITNDAKVALCEDLIPTPTPGPVAIARAKYFDTLVTNDMFGRELTRQMSVVLAGRELCTTSGLLDPLSESHASNHIGVSVLGLTPGGLLALVEQGNRSAQQPQRLAPTGSGSVDWADAVGAGTLLEMCRRAAAREFAEETSIRIDPSSLVPIGYARQMPRGGKPEFFFLARPRASKPDFVIRPSERGLTAGYEFFRVDGATPRRSAEMLLDLRGQLEGRCSPVLGLALTFLAEYFGASDADSAEDISGRAGA